MVFPDLTYETKAHITPDTAENTVYTVPVGYLAAMITEIRAADDGGTPRTVKLVARISGVDYTLVFAGATDDPDPRRELFEALVLKTGDSIKATSSASGVHILVSLVAQIRKS